MYKEIHRLPRDGVLVIALHPIGWTNGTIPIMSTCAHDDDILRGTRRVTFRRAYSPCTMGRGSPRGLREDGTTIPLVPVHAKKTIISWWSLLCHAMARHPLGDDMPCGWLEYSVRVSPSFPSPLHPLVYP